ncbi:hypothetical protein TrispH2_011686 [Trichoplax sp. H2]|nr:hypothetical protein TrispH2_011686 [Trichoplax sp. H2]|eukprot:RDD36254.1 hypothetical protein TrispH2_011686 [Trichoplax sp. H2]
MKPCDTKFEHSQPSELAVKPVVVSDLTKFETKISTQMPNRNIEPPQRMDTTDSQKKNQRVFISYSWSDKADVRYVKEFLESKNISCWIDEEKIYVGDELHPVIAKAIMSSEMFMPFLSKDYANSRNCYLEFNYAHLHQKTIKPVIIKDIDPKKDLISSDGKRDFYFLISTKVYTKILRQKQTADEFKKNLEKLYESIVKAKPETKSSQQQLSPAKDEVDKMDTETAPGKL